MKIMIVVTHLLGTGHLARALTLARAFQRANHTATVVSGGMPSPLLDRGDVPLLQIPPLRSDGVDFTRLLDLNGVPAAPAVREARTAQLTQHFHDLRPDVLITELFPFGRRTLRTEFLALLSAAKSRPSPPLICASIRDILAPPSSPQKAEKTHDILSLYYDAVLVHADPEFTPLNLSWPVTALLQQRLHYTGLIAPPPAAAHPQKAGADEIIISAGGGDVGSHIFETAMQAAVGDDRHWRLLLGGNQPPSRIAAFQACAPANVTVEAARPDFRTMLHHAAASVSMCGYNTAIDVLQSGCRAVFIPFDAGSEVEQTIRAQALANLPQIAVVKNEDLTPASLRSALTQLVAAPAGIPARTGFDGADETIRIVTDLRRKQHEN